jgi:hypothetical protein
MANTIENEGNKDQFLLSTNLPYNHKTNDNHHHHHHHHHPHNHHQNNNHSSNISDNLKSSNLVEFKKDLESVVKNEQHHLHHNHFLHSASRSSPMLDESSSSAATETTRLKSPIQQQHTGVKYGFLNSYQASPGTPYTGSNIAYTPPTTSSTVYSANGANQQTFFNYLDQSTDNKPQLDQPSLALYSNTGTIGFNEPGAYNQSSVDFSNTTSRIFTDTSNSLNNSPLYTATAHKLSSSSLSPPLQPLSSPPVWSNSMLHAPSSGLGPMSANSSHNVTSTTSSSGSFYAAPPNMKYNSNVENTNYGYQHQSMDYSNSHNQQQQQQMFRANMNFYPPTSYIQDPYYTGGVAQPPPSMMSYQSFSGAAPLPQQSLPSMQHPQSHPSLDFKFGSNPSTAAVVMSANESEMRVTKKQQQQHQSTAQSKQHKSGGGVKSSLSASLESEYKTSSDNEESGADEDDDDDEEEETEDEDDDDDENSSGSETAHNNGKKSNSKAHINAPWMHTGNFKLNFIFFSVFNPPQC